MAFELLSEPIRRYIKEKRWEGLRPIQVAAIEKIMLTDANYILASRTASGKTEAAFLPILSKIERLNDSVEVLYISPLIALINDQFVRVEDMCRELDIAVTKWHGEANRTAKENLVKSPNGVVLITPESLEAMLINRPYYVRALFHQLKYIVIDEIHSFMGSDRGTQLKSLLYRILRSSNSSPRIIGLSATVGSFEEAKKMTGDESNTVVLRDKASKPIKASFLYFESDATSLSLHLLKDLYKKTSNSKVLVFPNSRGRAEEVAVKLKKISEKVAGHQSYFSHHSSVDKELREGIEYFAKNNKYHPFVISCTSTLELGIDIGSVEQVVQIDATHSISSLIQRVGRSGRRDGQPSSLLLYATNKWSLLQSLACWELYNQDFIEPTETRIKSFDLLVHQILSFVKQKQGVNIQALTTEFASNFAFNDISTEEFTYILSHLIETDRLEQLGKEVIVGIEGERVVNSREFYTVFSSEPNFKVIHANKSIGDIPYSPQVIVGENLLLAAKIWKILDVDFKSKKILVNPANDGKAPIFGGDAGTLHPKIRIKMLEILLKDTLYTELDETSTEQLRELRKEFSGFHIESLEDDRPFVLKENSIHLHTFHGSKVNKTLTFLFGQANITSRLIDSSSTIIINENEGFNWQATVSKISAILEDIDFHLENMVIANPALLNFSKWGHLLPRDLQVEVLKSRYFDFDSAAEFLGNVNWVHHK
ncbi:ATP-dependent helicase Lhr and Lhr-like helicase [Sphingobacterium nematocida]|uniref:ATP-dependent helicase Lhr and Lhr-like helicase n=1 Tax=Sphingobacterium nematocida TaxID=1513896 RepID=A0A1T5GHS5_9SPHI|nr:DEAD/DEAH box helicase [Sphingobacterium nematocida]SKC08004.1 ATP-dependent helicase Lhr and Lhr-like helicase [Sphingobacterium nematocida]